jgi:LPS-assembly lipoprotein
MGGSRPSPGRQIAPTRRAALALIGGLPLLLAGCGWQPLYADPQTGPADADLRAIRVAPIPERIGQQLEIALRDALNPTGIPTPQRYVLNTTLSVSRLDLGIQAQGLATRGRIDVYATVALSELKTGKQLLTNTIHSANAFDILPNGYATTVAQDDADRRTVADLQREIMARLTLFMQRRIAHPGAKAS